MIDDVQLTVNGREYRVPYDVNAVVAHLINRLAMLESSVQAERESRRAAQIENEQLKAQIGRSGVEWRRVISQAVKEEREACAELCDTMRTAYPSERETRIHNLAVSNCAAALRARGRT